jgi:hypothetical protein
MADPERREPSTGVRIDWDDLEQALRRAAEAIRLTPRHVPGAIQGALGALRAAREGFGDRAALHATELAGVEAAVRAAGERLVHADRWIETARRRLWDLRAKTASV